MANRLVLTERFVPGLLNGGDETEIVALTPSVMVALDRAGVNYSIVEDFHDAGELNREDDAYWFSQLAWIDRIDASLKAHVPACRDDRITLAKQYLYHLKIAVDSYIIRARQLYAMIDGTGCNELIYVGAREGKRKVTEHLSYEGGSIFSHLAPLVATEKGLSFRRVSKRCDLNAFTGSVKDLLHRLRVAGGRQKQRLLRLLQHRPDEIQAGECADKRLSILALNFGYDIPAFVEAARGRGHRALLLEGNKIFDITKGREEYAVIPSSRETEDSSTWEAAWNQIATDRDIWRWVEEQAGGDICGVLKPVVRHFVTAVAPKLLNLSFWARSFLDRTEIDYVVAPGTSSVHGYSFRIGARLSRGTRTVNIFHGHGLFKLHSNDMIEYGPYDFLFIPDAELRDYARSRMAIYSGRKPEICDGDYFINQVHQLKGGRPRISGVGRKPTVVYVTAVTCGDGLFLNTALYTETWYFQYLKALLNSFEQEPSFDFVVKGLPSSDRMAIPLKGWISEKGYSNIEYHTNRFRDWLDKADRVIIDFPAMAAYEAISYGLPTLVLMRRDIPVRQKAIQIFSDNLCYFSESDEAVLAIREFLHSGPAPRSSTWQPSPGENILNVLEARHQTCEVQGDGRRDSTGRYEFSDNDPMMSNSLRPHSGLPFVR